MNSSMEDIVSIMKKLTGTIMRNFRVRDTKSCTEITNN